MKSGLVFMISFFQCAYLELIFCVYPISAQSFSPSPSWQNTTISNPLQTRIQLVNDAFDTARDHITSDGTFGADQDHFASAYLYGQIAEFDSMMGQTKYKDAVSGMLPLGSRTAQADSNAEYTLRLQLVYARSAVLAYSAYNDTSFLDIATTLWNFGNDYTLSDADIEAGTQLSGKKNFPLQKECRGTTMAGGSFCNTFSDDVCLSAQTSGTFLGLSTLLFNATSNSTYLTAAYRSLEWILAQTLDSDNGLIINTISAKQDDSTACQISPNGGYTYIAHGPGLLIDGLSRLISFTGNTSNENLLWNAVAAAIQNGTWQDPMGVVNYDLPDIQLSLDLFRGLGKASAFKTSPPSMKAYIEDYVGVQYNAILEQARMPNSSIYGGRWIGPPSSDFVPAGQTVATQILIDSILLVNQDNSSVDDGSSVSVSASSVSITPSSSASPNSTFPSSSSSAGNPAESRTRAIVGGVIGTLIFVALASGSAMYFFIHKRKKLPPVTPFLPSNSPQIQRGSGLASNLKDNKTSRVSTAAEERSTETTRTTDGIDTPELIRILYRRLQIAERPDENPPSYRESAITAT